MKIRTGFVSNSSSSSFIVGNREITEVKRDCYKIFKKYCKKATKESIIKEYFDEYFKFLFFDNTMEKEEKRAFCKTLNDFTYYGFTLHDLPKRDVVYILISEVFPYSDLMESGEYDKYNRRYTDGFYAFKDEVEEYFKAKYKHLG